jgi:hypothetical protein
MQPVSLNPLHDDPRLGDAVRQQDLFTDFHTNPTLLRGIPWERREGRRGFVETQDMERQALVNDFHFHGIPILVRIEDLEALRALHGDPAMTEITIMGPGRNAATYPHQAIPDEPYTITAQWQEFNPFFANWLNHRCAEDPALGAPWSKAVRVKTTDDQGGATIEYKHIPQPGRRLFRWRTPADLERGERPSGLIVPAGFSPFNGGDEDAAEEAAPAVAPKKGRA